MWSLWMLENTHYDIAISLSVKSLLKQYNCCRKLVTDNLFLIFICGNIIKHGALLYYVSSAMQLCRVFCIVAFTSRAHL